MIDCLRRRLPRPAIRLAKRLRDHLDSRLHPWRRRNALATFQGLPPNATILVLCHGNICRSPFAGILLQAGLGQHARIDSAGFLEGGRPSPATAVEAARELGVDLSAHRSVQVTKVHAAAASLVLVMDTAQRRRFRSQFPQSKSRVLVLSDLETRFHAPRGTPDPFDQPIETFREVYRRISEALDATISLTSR